MTFLISKIFNEQTISTARNTHLGGIKPCVSAFLGDQFSASQEHMLQRLFMYFYFSINLGSVFSTLLTPVIRSHWSYTAAFALPAVLLFISVLIFVSGRSYYRRVPPAGSIVSRSFGAVFLAAYRSAVVFFNRSNRHSQAPGLICDFYVSFSFH